MRRLIVAASLMMILATGRAAGDGFALPTPRDAAYVDIDSGTMTVIADRAPVTAAPDEKAKVIGLLKNGEQVTVYDSSEKWAHIHSKASNLDGYVRKSMLQ